MATPAESFLTGYASWSNHNIRKIPCQYSTKLSSLKRSSVLPMFRTTTVNLVITAMPVDSVSVTASFLSSLQRFGDDPGENSHALLQPVFRHIGVIQTHCILVSSVGEKGAARYKRNLLL
jgi:hypothetical protein